MDKHINTEEFETINQGYNSVYKLNKLSIGVTLPIEHYTNSAIPTMKEQIELVQLVEELGFSSIWLRDIPFNVPSFGDVGQMYDPFVYLGFLSAKTSKIALGVGSIILPLRHPAHVAKSAASIDNLSNGRLILGVASGDRPEEYPAMNLPFENRGERFLESFVYISQIWEDNPIFENKFGSHNGSLDMLPKPVAKKVPMLITGASQQDPNWVVSNGNGWITYPRNSELQSKIVKRLRDKANDLGIRNKPISQSLYLDLVNNPDAKPQAIHLGYRTGINYLIEHLKALELAGVNHVSLNLRFNQADIPKTLHALAKKLLPYFK